MPGMAQQTQGFWSQAEVVPVKPSWSLLSLVWESACPPSSSPRTALRNVGGERIKAETEGVRGGQGGKEGEKGMLPWSVTVKDGMRDHKTNKQERKR